MLHNHIYNHHNNIILNNHNNHKNHNHKFNKVKILLYQINKKLIVFLIIKIIKHMLNQNISIFLPIGHHYYIN